MARSGYDGNGDGVVKYRHGWQPVAERHPANRSNVSDWAGDAHRIGSIDMDYVDSDDRLAAMWAAQGFDGRPDVMSQREFDKLPDTYTRVYRGLHGEQAAAHAEGFRSGEAYAGLGVHGNGTYTATNRAAAQEFADAEHGGGEVMQIAIRPEAKVGTPMEIWERWDAQTRANGGEYRDMMNVAEGDVGKMATMLGYDVVRVDDETSSRDPGAYGSQYIIQNRTAVVVVAAPKAEAPEPAAPTDYYDFADYDTARDNR